MEAKYRSNISNNNLAHFQYKLRCAIIAKYTRNSKYFMKKIIQNMPLIIFISITYRNYNTLDI